MTYPEQNDGTGPDTREQGMTEQSFTFDPARFVRVRGVDEILNVTHLAPVDLELASMSSHSMATALQSMTVADVAKVKARIARELARQEERARLLIGVKDVLRAVME